MNKATRKKIQHIMREYNGMIVGHMHVIHINGVTLYCSHIVFGRSDVIFFRINQSDQRFVSRIIATISYEGIKEILVNGRRCIYD